MQEPNFVENDIIEAYVAKNRPNVVQNQPIVVQNQPNVESDFLFCVYCGFRGRAQEKIEYSEMTHFFAFACCISGCWPCCLIPYALDSFKKSTPVCAKCKREFPKK
mmetsp:Transcript_2279/g.3240  ORF Transcript_2279/g.3240 Transcript_2279/m.3240 type:complete len:106 (+) Transcript_2279:71-388(+)